MDEMEATPLESLERLYRLYLCMIAWGSEEFNMLDGPFDQLRLDFTNMVKDGSLMFRVQRSQIAAAVKNPGLPEPWLSVIGSSDKLQVGPLPEPERKYIGTLIVDMHPRILRLTADELRKAGDNGWDAYKTDPALNATDRDILQALGDKCMRGRELAKKSGHNEVKIRQRMKVLKPLGCVTNKGGYVRLK